MKENKELQKYALLAAMMASFLTPFMGSAVNLAIPAIGEEFGSGTMMLSWVVTSYILLSAAFLVPFGRLADIVGRKKIFMLGIALFSLSAILCGLAWSVNILILFRVMQGVGSSMIFGTGMAILTSVYPPQERGKILGMNVAIVYVGLSLGPVLGGALVHNLGWHSIFYFSAAVSLVALIITVAKLKGEWAGAKGENYDLMGAVLYSLGLVVFMYGISTFNTVYWAKYATVFGLVILVIFVKYEMYVQHPVLKLSLFSKNIAFAFSNLAALINYSATFAVGFLLSLYLQLVVGYNSQISGFILLSQPIIMAVLSPFAGKLSDRIEPRIVASWGMALSTLGLFVLCFINVNMPLWLLVLNLMLLGTGFALFSSPNNNAVMGSVEKKFYGVASSTLGTMRLVGQAVSMAIVTMILSFIVGNVEVSAANPELLVKATRLSFVIFTVICFAGIFASLARGNVNNLAKPH
ncbi:MFS transporter [Peptococcaceae bacterium 1198_IL3148]